MSAPTSSAEGTLAARLVRELERLPTSRAVALRVVRVVDDPLASAADVAGATGLDPALSARVLRLANSAYYGLSGRVGTLTFAVTVVGFTTVRSLAAVAAADLAPADALPPGFWDRAAAVGAGTALVAPLVGAPQQEAFCAGLLHDLGSAMLRSYDRALHDLVLAAVAVRPGPCALLHEELRAYGATHAGVCASVLAAWHFPPELCSAIAQHHAAPSRSHPPLLRALLAGQVLADLTVDPTRTAEQSAVLSAASVAPGDVEAMVGGVARARDLLGSALAA